MRQIKQLADTTALNWDSRDPFEICQGMGVYVFVVDLPHRVHGFYLEAVEEKFIYINANLSSVEQRITCAHELGHMLMHQGMNSLFLRFQTLFVEGRYEREADLFAACLLLDDGDCAAYLEEGCTCGQIALITGLEEKLVQMRLELYSHLFSRRKRIFSL